LSEAFCRFPVDPDLPSVVRRGLIDVYHRLHSPRILTLYLLMVVGIADDRDAAPALRLGPVEEAPSA